MNTKLTLIIFALSVSRLFAALDPNDPRVESGWIFEYKDHVYTNTYPPSAIVKKSAPWSIERGDPPLGASEAHKLAVAWIKENLDPQFDGIAHSLTISYQHSDDKKDRRGYWEIVFTEYGESQKKLREAMNTSGSDSGIYTPAHPRVYVLFDKQTFGPKIMKEKNGG